MSDVLEETDRSASRRVRTSSSEELNRSCWSWGQRPVNPGTASAHCLMTSTDRSSRTQHSRREYCEPSASLETSSSPYCNGYTTVSI